MVDKIKDLTDVLSELDKIILNLAKFYDNKNIDRKVEGLYEDLLFNCEQYNCKGCVFRCNKCKQTKGLLEEVSEFFKWERRLNNVFEYFPSSIYKDPIYSNPYFLLYNPEFIVGYVIRSKPQNNLVPFYILMRFYSRYIVAEFLSGEVIRRWTEIARRLVNKEGIVRSYYNRAIKYHARKCFDSCKKVDALYTLERLADILLYDKIRSDILDITRIFYGFLRSVRKDDYISFESENLYRNIVSMKGRGRRKLCNYVIRTQKASLYTLTMLSSISEMMERIDNLNIVRDKKIIQSNDYLEKTKRKYVYLRRVGVSKVINSNRDKNQLLDAINIVESLQYSCSFLPGWFVAGRLFSEFYKYDKLAVEPIVYE